MSAAPNTAHLVNTCQACGAEEALDSLLLRMIDDDTVRRLIADVITRSLPVGGLVVRYLRLHKPAKQRLRMSRVHGLLAELVPDIVAGRITRKGREWQAPMQAWKTALESVFEAQHKGTLTLPLDGNAYLYEVLLRQADRAEATAEKEQQDAQRHRTHHGGPSSLADVLAAAPVAAPAAVATVPDRAIPEPGTSYAVRRFKADQAAALARRNAGTTDTSPTTESNTP